MEMYRRSSARWLAIGCAIALFSAGAFAQGGNTSPPAGKVAPPPSDLEPGVNTSAIQPSSSEPTPASVPAPASATPAAAPKAQASKPAGAASRAVPQPSNPNTGPQPAAARTGVTTTSAAPPKGGAKAHDNIELDTTQITGNRELPKVLYIVPWKRSDLGDLVGKPVNSLLDEVLAPVDRDVFKRQNRYYDALKPDAARVDAAKDAAGTTSGASEKH